VNATITWKKSNHRKRVGNSETLRGRPGVSPTDAREALKKAQKPRITK